MQQGGGVLSLSVQGRRAGLLSQIEQDVLDDGKPIGSALRRFWKFPETATWNASFV